MKRRFRDLFHKSKDKSISLGNKKNLRKKDGGFGGVCPQFSRSSEGKAQCHGEVLGAKDCEGKHVIRAITTSSLKPDYCHLYGATKKQVEKVKELQKKNIEIDARRVNENKIEFTAIIDGKKVKFNENY